MALTSDRISGVILAGGAGSRMDGSDKGLLLYRDKPLIVHAIERLGPQVGELMISANRNTDIYTGFGFPVVSDAQNPQQETYAGPLAGVLAALKACRTDWLLTVACDTPAFPADLAARFCAATAQAGCSDLLFVRTPVQSHPVFMLVHRELTHTLAAFIASGERKIGMWQRLNGATPVDFPNEAAFNNLNTLDELNAAEKHN